MNAPNPSAMADRDARRLARVLSEVGGTGEAIAGGWMACDEPGSWADFAAGLGIAREFTAEDAQTLIDYYAARGCPAKVQATPYQHESLFRELGSRGFVLHETETVLVRGLGGLESGDPRFEFRTVDPDDAESVQRCVDLHLQGFYPDGKGPASTRRIMERVVQDARVTLWVVEEDGEPVGSGGLERFENCGVLVAGCTLAPARRRGVQQALIGHRLAEARRLGLEYALISSSPGGPTERNACRAGFTPAYTQLCLRREHTATVVPPAPGVS